MDAGQRCYGESNRGNLNRSGYSGMNTIRTTIMEVQKMNVKECVEKSIYIATEYYNRYIIVILLCSDLYMNLFPQSYLKL